MKILLGVDASSHCRATISTLCRMKWPAGTEVTLVSAVAPAEALYAPEPHVLASSGQVLGLIEEDYVRTHEELLIQTERELQNCGFVTSTRVEPGEPGHLIVTTAETEGADLIVVGCHGPSGLGRRLLGSVASYVVAHAPCNVLVIKGNHT